MPLRSRGRPGYAQAPCANLRDSAWWQSSDMTTSAAHPAGCGVHWPTTAASCMLLSQPCAMTMVMQCWTSCSGCIGRHACMLRALRRRQRSMDRNCKLTCVAFGLPQLPTGGVAMGSPGGSAHHCTHAYGTLHMHGTPHTLVAAVCTRSSFSFLRLAPRWPPPSAVPDALACTRLAGSALASWRQFEARGP